MDLAINEQLGLKLIDSLEKEFETWQVIYRGKIGWAFEKNGIMIASKNAAIIYNTGLPLFIEGEIGKKFHEIVSKRRDEVIKNSKNSHEYEENVKGLEIIKKL